MTTVRLVGVVLALAGLDLAGSICLKEAALRRSPVLALTGAGLFVLLALTLYVALEAAELSIVNLGWIVLLQAAVLAVDALRYGVTPGRLQMVAISVAMVALVVAILAPGGEPADTSACAPASSAAIPAPREPGELETELLRRVRYAQWKKTGEDRL